MTAKTLSQTFVLRLFLPFAVAYFASVLLRNVNAVAAPDLVRDFSLNPADLGLLSSLYFVAFTLAQLPLGSLLDRFDSARVNATALLFAAAGTALFSVAQNTLMLGLGRALIGLGVAVCLMSSLRAFSIWLPSAQQPMANGFMFAIGTLGAIAATVPAQWAIAAFGWRAVFMGCAGLVVFAVAALLLVPPPCRSQASTQRPLSMRSALGHVWRTRQARHSFPAVSFAAGTLWAVQSLWAGPWLSNVAGLSGDALARTLICMPIGMLMGNLFHGWVTGRLRAAGKDGYVYNRWMVLAFALMMIPFVMKLTAALPLIFFAFGFFGSATTNYFALLTPYYPKEIVGRANAALNMALFGTIFFLQWGIGVVVNYYRVDSVVGATGFTVAFTALLIVLLAFTAWLWPVRDDLQLAKTA
jgi:predicted MFS family arabinose efflux permease